MADQPTENDGKQEGEEEENYFHFHARMTVDLCFGVNLSQVNANVFDSAYLDNMPEATAQAYQQLWRRMLADQQTRRQLLATMLIERCIDLYHNTEDILTDLAEDEDLVNEEGKRVEIVDLTTDHLAPGAPYYWWKNAEATEWTFLAEEGIGGLDVEALHACITDDIAHLSFEEVAPDD